MSIHPSLRALVVEDEGIVLLELTLVLSDLGYSIAGTAADPETGVELARSLDCDFAVIDFNLSGRDSTAIADVLANRGIPFLFLTGYTRSTLPERHADRQLVPKPCSAAQLASAIEQSIRQSR